MNETTDNEPRDALGRTASEAAASNALIKQALAMAAAGASDDERGGQEDGLAKPEANTAATVSETVAGATTAPGGPGATAFAGGAFGDGVVPGAGGSAAASGDGDSGNAEVPKVGSSNSGRGVAVSAVVRSGNAPPIGKLKKSGPRKIRFELKVANPHITCELCAGYLINATTIIECLHTFCKSCIVKHFEEKSHDCPTCNKTVHETNPYETLRQDRTIQAIVFKIVKSLQSDERKREEEFNAKRGIKRSSSGDKAGISDAANNPVKKRVRRENASSQDDQISFVLEKIADKDAMVPEVVEEENANVKRLEKPYIRTSAKATILHLKKFLMKKLKLQRPDDVDILCNDEVMGKEYTLEFIKRSRWRKEDDQLKLMYRQKVDFDHFESADPG